MFEEAQVCLLCGRPVDSQVYCSDECESLDAASPAVTSPSLSATSSVYPSPYLASTHALGDVPALIPSVLGHRPHTSISSSNSSTGWSALTEEELEAAAAVTVNNFNQNNINFADMAHPLDDAAKSPQLLHPHGSGLSFMRRPSTTNHRSTVPMLLRQGSSATTTTASSSSAASRGIPSPLFVSVVADDHDDASSLCLSDSARSNLDTQQHLSVSAGLSSSMKKKRNRASLPAYFSLLQNHEPSLPSTATNSLASSRHCRTPAELPQISRSLHASPTTPKVAYATATFTRDGSAAAQAADSTATIKTWVTSPNAADERERGRGRKSHRSRGSDACSASSRREVARSPVRHDRAYQLHNHAHAPENEHECGQRQSGLSAAQRARINSVEKVAEWVVSSSSPGMCEYAARRRRDSSPRRDEGKVREQARFEFVRALRRGLRGCAVAGDDEDDGEDSREDVDNEKMPERDVRGRRRVDELDVPLSEAAPGLGSGRSGLRVREERARAREERERERGQAGR